MDCHSGALRCREGQEAGGQDRQGWTSPSKTVVSGPSAAPHNHKVPVLISPTLKHSPADVHLVGMDSQGNRFKLLSEHQADRDRPRLVKPKCAPPPPPTLRLIGHSYSGDGEEQVVGAVEVNGDGVKRPGRAREVGTGRPSVPPPQVPPPTSASSFSSANNTNTTPTKMANGATSTASSTAPSGGSKPLRRTRQQAERVQPEKISKEALLECAECLRGALHSSPEPSSSSQVLDAGHQLLDYCSGYVDCIPQMRNKFAFREAVGKLELSLQELRASSSSGIGGAFSGPGPSPALDNLHICIKEISDVVQR